MRKSGPALLRRRLIGKRWSNSVASSKSKNRSETYASVA
jgi:hypothetical protein